MDCRTAESLLHSKSKTTHIVPHPVNIGARKIQEMFSWPGVSLVFRKAKCLGHSAEGKSLCTRAAQHFNCQKEEWLLGSLLSELTGSSDATEVSLLLWRCERERYVGAVKCCWWQEGLSVFRDRGPACYDTAWQINKNIFLGRKERQAILGWIKICQEHKKPLSLKSTALASA